MMDIEDASAIARRLSDWAADFDESSISDVRRLEGHSGVSYAFDAVRPSGARRLVLRLAPLGVRSVEGADVLRQAPVLRAAEGAGVPVPHVVDTGSAPGPFGTDYMVVEFVSGRALPDLFLREAQPPPGLDIAETFRSAAATLAGIHAVPWRTALSGWEPQRSIESMMAALPPALERAEDPMWTRRGEMLHQRLRARLPTGTRVGLVHNDYYSNNWILDSERPVVSAVLDWETACIGPVGLDLGWLALMHDRPAWSCDQRPDMSWLPTLDRLVDAYAGAGGDVPDDLDWYRSFSCLRLVSGTAYYLRLHRRGKRVDDTWEGFALSVPSLLDRAFELLG